MLHSYDSSQVHGSPPNLEHVSMIFQNARYDIWICEREHIDGLVQDCGNYSTLAVELTQSCV